MASNDDSIQKQKAIIEQHEKKMEDLMTTIKARKDETSKKMDQLVEMLAALTKCYHKLSTREASTNRRRKEHLSMETSIILLNP
jgi:uncharacterized protein YfbU (UPF0304 family)